MIQPIKAKVVESAEPRSHYLVVVRWGPDEWEAEQKLHPSFEEAKRSAVNLRFKYPSVQTYRVIEIPPLPIDTEGEGKD